MTKVIFRKFKDGEVIALFPQEPATSDGWECMSYMHIGQHATATPDLMYNTKPAMPWEYSELYKELKSVGYNDLAVCKRFTRYDYNVRKERARL